MFEPRMVQILAAIALVVVWVGLLWMYFSLKDE